MEALAPHLITGVHGIDDVGIARLARGLGARLGAIATEEPIPYLPMTDEFYDHSIALHPHVAAGLTGGAAHRRPS